MNPNSRYLRVVPLTFTFLMVVLVSGLVTRLLGAEQGWLQANTLLHVIAGTLFSVLLIYYVVLHFNTSIKFRRAGVMLTGFLCLLFSVIFLVSGWGMVIVGQLERHEYLLLFHLIGAVGFILLLLVHIATHALTLSKSRRAEAKRAWPSVSNVRPRQTIVVLVVLQLCALLVGVTDKIFFNAAYSPKSISDYTQDYGPDPFVPSETTLAGRPFLHAEALAGSQRCGKCHESIYSQWLSSAHSQAASDPSYVRNINLLVESKGIAAARYCEGCHAPIALLSGELTEGGQHGGVVGTLANNEGVSCMTCHSVSMLEHTKGNGSYNIALPSPDLFRNSGIPIIQHIGDFLLRVRPEKHKRDMLKPVMNDSSYCASCHSQYMEENMNNWGWVKMQDEYTAWANSPYSGQHPFGFSDENIQRCQDCHMPMVPVDGLAADSNGDGASHRFLGSNTFLPSVSNDNQQLGLVSDFLRSNKVRVSIVEPNRIESIQTRSSLQADLREKSLRESTAFYYHGETTNLEVVVANIAVGHNFPGGTIDLNQVWLEVIVTDAVGQEIYTSGALDDDGVLSETAYVYGAIAVDRQGKEVWKHDLFNMTGEVFHRTIKSGDADVAKFDLFIPAWANSPLTISATLRYRKFNKRYSSWVMHGAKHSLPIVDMAFDRKTIPLKKRREVE